MRICKEKREGKNRNLEEFNKKLKGMSGNTDWK